MVWIELAEEQELLMELEEQEQMEKTNDVESEGCLSQYDNLEILERI